MFEIIFGLFWTACTAVVTFASYFSGTTISVNGQIVSQEEFNEMLFPKIFLGIFWAVGLFMLYLGISKIIKNYRTSEYGEICYGRIIDISKSGTYVNDVPELKALVTVYVESTGTLENVEEVIGLATEKKYKIGDYIEGKYYNGDINIESYLDESIVPSHLQPLFANLVTKSVEDTIVIDGIEYVKKDSIK